MGMEEEFVPQVLPRPMLQYWTFK